MPEKLHQYFSLANEDLKTLNYNCAKAFIGIKIFSYVETRETGLRVLSSNDGSGEFLTRVRGCIVDDRSAVLDRADISVDEEEVESLYSTHIGAQQFQDQSIMDNIRVDVHQF
ncbi:MAG: hypothetical protein Q9166_007233 [cf. Caloplaca sp. 2 TL-2023]